MFPKEYLELLLNILNWIKIKISETIFKKTKKKTQHTSDISHNMNYKYQHRIFFWMFCSIAHRTLETKPHLPHILEYWEIICAIRKSGSHFFYMISDNWQNFFHFVFNETPIISFYFLYYLQWWWGHSYLLRFIRISLEMSYWERMKSWQISQISSHIHGQFLIEHDTLI